MDEVIEGSLSAALLRLARREISSRELTLAMLARIEALEPELHSYATVRPELALAAAERADAVRQSHDNSSSLLGIPLGLKDIIATADLPTHVGGLALRNWQPGVESTVARRLREAGAVMLGKHQTTEAACGDHHPTITRPVNPFHPLAWTGVSSSGSAVATAAGLSFASFGSDTGGSIRFPSHACGLVGLKPTWGRVSRYGVFPLAETLDHVGPIARHVEDVAKLFEVVAGEDERDPSSLNARLESWSADSSHVDDLRVGFDESYCSEGLDPQLRDSLSLGRDILRAAGAKIVPIKVPSSSEVVADWLTLCATQAVQAHHETYPARAAEYGPALSALLEFGRKLSIDEVEKATQARQHFSTRYQALFEHVDVLLSPSSYDLTPTIDDAAGRMRGAGMRRFVTFTAPANLSGNPTLSLPSGLDASGVPFGYQLIGRHLGEQDLFRAGYEIQKSSHWPVAPALRAG